MNLQTGRYGACAVAWEGRGYVFGGASAKELIGDSVEVVNLRSGSGAVLPWKLLPRRFHGAAMIDGCAYITGGTYATLERLDLRTGKVETRRPCPTPRHAGAVVANSGLLWVIGGYVNGVYSGATEVYDPKRDTWDVAPPMPTPRECTATVHNGMIHVIGGYAGGGDLPAQQHDIYVIAQARWLPSRKLPVPTSANRVGVVGGILHSFGDYGQPERVQAYDLRAERWFTPRLSEAFVPRRHAAIATEGNTIAVIGGNVAGGGAPLDTLQLFRIQKQK